MSDARFLVADDRGVLALAGQDARTFLQGLISADVTAVNADRARWAALLTPQGKFLYDMILVEHQGALWLDCESARRADLAKKLGLYRLRAEVAITDRSEDLAVALVWGADAADSLGLPAQPGAARAWQGGVALVDPRLAAAGARVIAPRAGLAAALAEAGLTAGQRNDWDRLRIGLGLPDGSRDLVIEKAILLENGFDELGGIAWDKGCWMGQELTARTRYRGLVKKRLVPVRIAGSLPAPGTPVEQAGREVGEIRSGAGEMALALLRLDALDRASPESLPLLAGGAVITPVWPDWLKRGEAAAAP